jgi:hypothetical protein
MIFGHKDTDKMNTQEMVKSLFETEEWVILEKWVQRRRERNVKEPESIAAFERWYRKKYGKVCFFTSDWQ